MLQVYDKKKDFFVFLYKFFYHVHLFFKMGWNEAFQFIQNDTFGRLHPVGKFSVRLICFCKIQQPFQIEVLVHYSRSVLHGIVGIAFLLDVSRYHQDRLSEIHRLADRFKSGRTGIRLASRHLPQEERIVQLIERQRVIYPLYRLLVPSVPEEAERYIRTLLMPFVYIFCKSRVDHVAVDIVMLRNLLIENILSQQRWNGKYLLLLVRVHRAERQSQAFRCPPAKSSG